MDHQLALDLSAAYAAYAGRLAGTAAPAVPAPVAPAGAYGSTFPLPKPTTSAEYGIRKRVALEHVFVNDGDIPQADFAAYAVEVCGYEPNGLGGFWSTASSSGPLLNLHHVDGVPYLQLSVKGYDYLAKYGVTAA